MLFHFQSTTEPKRLDFQVSTDNGQLFLQRNQLSFVLVETGTQELAQATRRTRNFTRCERCQRRKRVQRVEQKVRIHSSLKGAHFGRDNRPYSFITLADLRYDRENQRCTQTFQDWGHANLVKVAQRRRSHVGSEQEDETAPQQRYG